MDIKLSIEEIKYAALVHIFTKTGARIQPEEAEIHFIKDGSSTRVDEVVINKTE